MVLAVTFLPTEVPLSFLVPLALLIVTMVSEIEGTAIGLVITQIVYATVILCGLGPAALRHMPMGLQLHYAQVFLGFLITVLLPVAAAVTEAQRVARRHDTGSTPPCAKAKAATARPPSASIPPARPSRNSWPP